MRVSGVEVWDKLHVRLYGNPTITKPSSYYAFMHGFLQFSGRPQLNKVIQLV